MLLPVTHLRLQRLAGQPLSLPQRIIGVLDGQFRQRRRLSRLKRAVKRDHLSHKDASGPGVACYVMRHEKQGVIVVADPEQCGAQHRPLDEVEWASRLFDCESPQFSLPRGLR